MGTQNFFLSYARDETGKHFFIYFFSGLEIYPSFLFYLLPCGYFPNKSKGLCLRCSMEKRFDSKETIRIISCPKANCRWRHLYPSYCWEKNQHIYDELILNKGCELGKKNTCLDSQPLSQTDG